MRRRRRRRAGSRRAPAPVYTVYVVELREQAWEWSKKLRDANPRGSLDRPCVYVGSTAKTPEARFEVHHRGGMHSSKVVFRYGRALRSDLYVDVPVVRTTRADAEAAERKCAARLRRMGLRVWQG